MLYSLIADLDHAIHRDVPSSFWFLAVTCIFSLLRIVLNYSGDQKKNRLPPLAKEALPVVGHVKIFLNDSEKLASIISFKLPFDELWLARGFSNILSVLSDPKIFDFEPMKGMVLKRILGLSGRALHAVNQDDSGVSTKPLPGTHVPAHLRFNYMERKATQDFSRPTSHLAFVEHFEKNLYDWVENCDIFSEWIEMPDLYIFVRDLLFRNTTDAFFGPHLLKMSPNLAQDIWKFDEEIPYLAKGFPTIFNPYAHMIRAKCTQALHKWRTFALGNRQSTSTLPEWNELSGLKCSSLRNEVFDKFDGWDEKSRAASDMAVLFGLNSNSVRATFWFLFETLRSKDLFEDASEEVSKSSTTSDLPSRFSARTLLKSSLLQSIYAETLRVYVSVMMLRKSRRDSWLGKWFIPKDKKIVVCNYSEHMDPNLWQSQSTGEAQPVHEFWGRRFLTSTSSVGVPNPGKSSQTPQFLSENLGCKWFPFGYGERMCPGRHFAKHQMLLTFALMTSVFDIELLVPQDWKPNPDMKHFGYGVMPPDAPTRFRIRKKVRPNLA